MASIIFYSNFCENSKGLLAILAKSQIKERLHYLCIDNRARKADGSTYIILENRQEVLLPQNIIRVPALLLLSKNNEVVFGKDSILKYLKPHEDVINQKATSYNGEPSAFSFGFGSGSSSGLSVVSDNYSFWDQSDAPTNKELTATGNGGLRQMHHYATLDFNESIYTPPDDYTPDKVGSESIEKYQQARNMDLNKK